MPRPPKPKPSQKQVHHAFVQDARVPADPYAITAPIDAAYVARMRPHHRAPMPGWGHWTQDDEDAPVHLPTWIRQEDDL